MAGGSGQRASGQKSGGMSIDNHAPYPRDKQTVMARGVKVSGVPESDGMGDKMVYEDTEPEIRAQQEAGVKKERAHQPKPLYRN